MANYYVITRIDGAAESCVVEGYAAIAALKEQGRRVTFRAFASADAAGRFAETGEARCGSHAHGNRSQTYAKAYGLGQISGKR